MIWKNAIMFKVYLSFNTACITQLCILFVVVKYLFLLNRHLRKSRYNIMHAYRFEEFRLSKFHPLFSTSHSHIARFFKCKLAANLISVNNITAFLVRHITIFAISGTLWRSC